MWNRAVRMEGGKREVAESGTARSSQCVCAQASAQGSTKGPLYCQKHTHSQLLSHYWLSKFDRDYSSLVSPPPLLLTSWQTPTLLSRRSLVFLATSCLSSRLHLPSSPLFAVSPGWIIHDSSLCQMASALLIQKDSFHQGPVCGGVCLCGLYIYVWVGGWDNGAVGGRLLWQPTESHRKER